MKNIMIVLFLVCVSGCTMPIHETYISSDNETQSLELGSDGMYVLHLNQSYTGQYHISNDRVYLSYPMGYTVTLQIVGNQLIDENGTIWEKS
uniref:Uncharacterized protein n=1 Tax=viral metagenome TaxID=1070528 RepID=A0A6M3MDU7_9ZZZZ